MSGTTRVFAAAGAVASLILIPGIASADFVLDTGTPNGSGAPVILSTAQWLAGEFAVTAGQDITALSAYLTQGVGEPGDTFTFDIYSSAGFTGRSTGRNLVYSAGGTFLANGWNSTAVNWTPTSSGDYWLALQVSSTSQTKGLDAPVETSAGTGTVPALAFAYLGSGTSGEYTTAGAPAIGLEVTESPVPLPTSALLLGSGLLGGIGAVARRRRGPRGIMRR
jgi:hypothetical protein